MATNQVPAKREDSSFAGEGGASSKSTGGFTDVQDERVDRHVMKARAGGGNKQESNI